MDIGWDDLRLFLAVADAGSLSGAARQLRLGQPTISRRLALLEEQLGYPLFRRGVAGAALTPDGERLLPPARRMAEWAGEATRAAEQHDARPRGLVRVTAPPGIAFDFLVGFTADLRTRLPEIRLEILSTTQYLDLTRREADLALRGRLPEQRDYVVVAERSHEVAAFVSRDYRRRHQRVRSLSDLDWIAWAPPYENVVPNPQLAAGIPGFVPVFTSDDYLVQQRAAEAGIGAVFKAKIQHRYLPRTDLVPLPLPLGPHARGVTYLLSTKSALEIARIRMVAELLAAEMGRIRPLPDRPRGGVG